MMIDWQYEDLHFAARYVDGKPHTTSSAICNGLGFTTRHLSALQEAFADGLRPLREDLESIRNGGKQKMWPIEYGLSVAFGAHRLFGLGYASDDDARIEERATLHILEHAIKTPLSAGEWAVALRRVGEHTAVLRTLQKVSQEVSLDLFKVPHLRYPKQE